VAIGLLTSIALLIAELLADNTGPIDIIAIIAPFIASLGIRPLVTPVSKVVPAPPSTTTQKAT
jgi:hypothetical protein